MNKILQRQHISTKVFKSYIALLEQNYPEINVNEAIIQCGLTREYIENPDNWVSIIFSRDFTKLCNSIVKDNMLQQKAGAYAISEQVLGKAVYLVVKNLVSLRAFFFAIPKLVKYVNHILRFNVRSSSSTCIEFEIFPNNDNLTNEEKIALEEELPFIIQNTIGWCSASPRMFGFNDAKVILSKTISNENKSFTLKVQHPALAFGLIPFNLQLLAVFTTCFVLTGYLFQTLSVLMLFFIGIFFANFFGLIYQHKRIKILRFFAVETELALQKIDIQYEELRFTKERLSRQYQESILVSKILENLIQTNSVNVVFNKTCSCITELLGYSRVIIMTSDNETGQLHYETSSGMGEEEEKIFSQFKLPMKINSDSRYQLTNVFRFKTPLLVDNISQHLELIGEESQRLIASTGTNSFLAVPIYSSLRNYGIIIADCNENKKILTQDDLALMQIVSNQIAIALDKEFAQREAIEAYESSSKMKDEFLAKTSHELRTPLHGIIGLSESILEMDFSKSEQEIKENISLITNSSKKLSSLVNNILDFSILNNNALGINKKETDLLSAIDVSVRFFKPLAEKKQLYLKFHSELTSAICDVDEDRIQQILNNLMGNAIKFTQVGGVEIVVSEENGNIRVAISDTGVGILKKDLDRIFEPFQQVEGSHSRRFDGTGLGLSITKELIKLQNGILSVNSVFGKGSTFFFTFPKSNKSVFPKKESTFELNDGFNSKYLSQIEKQSSIEVLESDCLGHILIVDDEIVNLQVLKNYLKQSSFKVTSANSGQDALKMLDGNLNPDLILMDVMMPGMTGYEACEFIRKSKNSAQLPVIFLTALREETNLIEALESGGNDFLTKPFSKKELIVRVKNLVESSRLSNAFSKFVPWSLLETLGYKNVTHVKLGDYFEKEMTYMFLDIRGFTTFCENTPPQEVMKFLNSLLSTLAPIIQKNKGVIDKFIGDGIMAMFDSPKDAIFAAILMAKELNNYNEKHRSGGVRKHIKCGIGINTGHAIIAPIGYEDRISITSIGDTVNTAARVESLTKSFSCSIVITDETLKKSGIENSICFRNLGLVQLKGKNEKSKIVEIFEADNLELKEHKKKTLSVFENAVNFFINNEFHKALEAFRSIYTEKIEDSGLKIYLEKSIFALEEELREVQEKLNKNSINFNEAS